MANPLLALDPATVRRIQARVGLPPNEQDGDLGPRTLRAIDETLAAMEAFLAAQIGKSPISTATGKPTPAAPRAESVNLPELVAINAEEEEGIREEGGNNRGPRVQEYQKATWLDGTGWAWCAAFVCFVIREAIEGRTVKFKRPLTAAAWDFERWATEQAGADVQLFKPRSKTTIRRGDLVVFEISHIGIAIADEKDGYVETIEGNTGPSGGREGDGVWKKRRRVSEFRSVIRLPQK